jgi:WXXGXW repeat (2 copies)
MKLTYIAPLGLACGGAPIALHAGVDIGINVMVPVPGVVYVGQPPPPRVEVITQAPGPDYFWIGGRWNYVNSRWVWINGRYDRHPHFHPGGGWEAGRWETRGNNSVWHEGHWR